MRQIILYTIGVLMAACHQKPVPQSADSGRSFARRIDSIRYLMPNVNAACFMYIDSNGIVYKKIWGKTVQNDLVSDTTIFEGASLSKTITAYIFWQMVKDSSILDYTIKLPLCQKASTANLNVLRLLRHSVRCKDHCVQEYKVDSFRYSEDNYLLLQHYLESISGKSLQTLAKQYVFEPLKMRHSTFIWNDSITDFVDGYYQDNRKHRNMYQFKQATANGSLYTCAADMVIFAKALVQSDFTDSVSKALSRVHQYKKLHWGLGMGVDSSLQHQIFWQWGCNWSYNHILILDTHRKDIIIGMTNSMIGAKRLRYACNYLKGNDLELFDYINWY